MTLNLSSSCPYLLNSEITVPVTLLMGYSGLNPGFVQDRQALYQLSRTLQPNPTFCCAHLLSAHPQPCLWSYPGTLTGRDPGKMAPWTLLSPRPPLLLWYLYGASVRVKSTSSGRPHRAATAAVRQRHAHGGFQSVPGAASSPRSIGNRENRLVTRGRHHPSEVSQDGGPKLEGGVLISKPHPCLSSHQVLLS